MADDYQNRKDIDNLYNLIWDSDNDRTQFVSREEFEEFKSHTDIIDLLGKSMDSSSYNLFAKFKNDLDETGIALGELNDNFEYLDGLLMGDDENEGFVDLLRTLQRQMYGEGEYDLDGNPYTFQYASSNSLKGLLDALHGQLGDLSDGDTKLSATLNALTSKLTAFGGNLDQFKTQLQNENPQLYADMSESMIDLVYAIASTKSDINDHQGRIESTEALIGSETDSASTQDGSANNPYTVFGILNDTSETASDTSSKAVALTNTLYKGTGNNHNESATPTNPATGSTIQLLNNARGRVGDLETDVGDVSQFTGATISTALKNSQTAIGDTSKFTGTDLSSAMKTAQGNITTTDGKIGNTNLFEGVSISGALQSIQSKIGTVNIGSNTSITSAIGSLQALVGTVNIGSNTSITNEINSLKTYIGSVNIGSNTSITSAIGSLQSIVGSASFTGSDITTAIGSLQANIGDMNFTGSTISLALYNSQIAIGNTNLFEGNSISIALKNGQDDIQYVYDKHEALLSVIVDSFPAVVVVETENDKNDIDFFSYEFIYVKETGKFYKYEVQE